MFYQVDEEPDSLDLLPMAARRALDLAGCRLSLHAWQGLALSVRRQLAELGGRAEVSVEEVWSLVGQAQPKPQHMEIVPDLAEDAPPPGIVEAYGPERRIPAGTWSALSRLDRFVLAKVAARPRPRRLELAYDEIVGRSGVSPHLAATGGTRMVGVTAKPETLRTARAESWVSMQPDTLKRLSDGAAAKGDVLGTAKLAAISAVKRTADLIPLCHPLRITRVDVDCELVASESRVRVVTRVEAVDRTGVEMEALTAAMTAALTVYDMLKAYDRGMEIGPTRLLEKSGGRSGDWRRESV